MKIFLQILISIAISVIVWVATIVRVLSWSHFSGGGFLAPNMPLATSAFYGLIVGVLHGLVVGIVIWVWRPTSWTSSLVASFVATELFVVFVSWGLGFSRSNWRSILDVGGWIVILSIICLFHTVVIGVANRLADKLIPD